MRDYLTPDVVDRLVTMVLVTWAVGLLLAFLATLLLLAMVAEKNDAACDRIKARRSR